LLLKNFIPPQSNYLKNNFMDEATKKEIFDGVKAIVDSSIAETVKEVAGKEVAERATAIFTKMKKDQARFGVDASGLDNETKAAFATDIKNIMNGSLVNGSAKAALLVNSDTSGGFLVPTEVYAGIMRVAASSGLVARDASHFPMGSESLEIPRYSGSDLEGAYLGEDVEGTETSITFGDAKLMAKSWYTIFRIGNTLLRDATADVGASMLTLAMQHRP
jgi:HK97 family phage major capsid protein